MSGARLNFFGRWAKTPQLVEAAKWRPLNATTMNEADSEMREKARSEGCTFGQLQQTPKNKPTTP